MVHKAVELVLVAAGGAVGACIRYELTNVMTKRLGAAFPWATLTVNCVGCLLIGVVNTLLEQSVLPPWVKPLVTGGFLGALTTFSSFSWDTLSLIRKRHALRVCANVLANVAASLLLVAAGHFATSSLVRVARSQIHHSDASSQPSSSPSWSDIVDMSETD